MSARVFFVLSCAVTLACASGCEKKKNEGAVDAAPPPSSSAPSSIRPPPPRVRTGRSPSHLVGLSRDRARALVYEDDMIGRAGEYRWVEIASKAVLSRWSLSALQGGAPGLREVPPKPEYFAEKLAHPRLAADVLQQGTQLAELDDPAPGPRVRVARSADGKLFIVDIGNGFHLAGANGAVIRPWGNPAWRSPVRSPDGKLVAFTEGKHVLVAPIAEEPTARAVVTADAIKEDDLPHWSPDSATLFFATERCLEKVDVRAPSPRATKLVCIPVSPGATILSGQWDYVLSDNRRWAGITFDRGRGSLFLLADLASKRTPEESPMALERPLAISDDGLFVMANDEYSTEKQIAVASPGKIESRWIPKENAEHIATAAWISPRSPVYAWHDTLETIDVAP